MRSTLRFWVTLLGIWAASACGTAEVRTLDDGTVVDVKCFDACIAKDVSDSDCAAFCSDEKFTGTKPGRSSDAGAGNPEPVLDPGLEKSCIECWFDETSLGGRCTDEAKACEASLACTQLQWCPLLCGKPGCVPECNEVIPTGVEPLTELVRCAACAGGPCADACSDSVMLAYCP